MNEASIHREIKQNFKPRGSYTAKHTQMLVDKRKKEGHYKIVFSHLMKRIIIEKMTGEQWSPEQIVVWCKLKNISIHMER